MRSLLLIVLLTSACGSSQQQQPANPVAPEVASSPPSVAAPSSCGEIDAIAARVDQEWGTPESPHFAFAGHVEDVSKRVQAYDKQRRSFVDDLRPHTTKGLACASVAHVHIGVVDDIFRAAVLRAKLNTIPPDAEAKLVDIETNANKVLSDPSSSPQQRENAKAMLAKAKEVRDNTASMGQTALKGWSAYAEMELIDAYARGMIEARKAGLKGPIYANAWRRMGAIVADVGVEKVNERLEQVKKEHADVPIDASAFQSACTWPAGC